MGAARSEDSEPRWFEYPIGRRGELATAVASAAVPTLIGVGAIAALIIGTGFLAEGDLLGDPALELLLDRHLRIAIIPIAVVAWLGWLMLGAVGLARDLAISRSVLSAARSGEADPRAIPVQPQVERIVLAPGRILFTGAVVGGLVLALLTVLGLAIAVSASIEGAMIVVLGLAILTAGHGWLVWVMLKRTIPDHESRRREIAQYFSLNAEKAIWQRAARGSAADDAQPVAAEQQIRLGAALSYAGLGLAVACGVLLHAALLFTHPEAEHWAGQQLGERAEFSETTEAGIGIAFWGIVVLLVLAAIIAVVGALLEVIAQGRERTMLMARLDGDDDRRPPELVIRRRMRRQVPRPVQLLAVLSGAGLVLGLSGLALAAIPAPPLPELYTGAREAFAPRLGIFLVSTLVCVLGIGLSAGLTARSATAGAPLRQALAARWPTAPEPMAADADKEIRRAEQEKRRARNGPSLRPKRSGRKR